MTNPAKLASDNLFPACAGVILIANEKSHKFVPFPRVCGGDPRFHQ